MRLVLVHRWRQLHALARRAATIRTGPLPDSQQAVVDAGQQDRDLRTGRAVIANPCRLSPVGDRAAIAWKEVRDHGNVAHEYFLPSGPFAILPLTDSRASLVWTETTRRAEALKTASDAAFQAHLMRRFGDFLDDVTVVGPRFVYPLSHCSNYQADTD